MIFDLAYQTVGIEQALIKVTGIDAEDFLQKQLSNDISVVNKDIVQINAYCTHQGRIVALLRVFTLKGDYYLLLPKDLVEKTLKRLQMFVLNARVILKDVSDDFRLLGVLDELDLKKINPEGLGHFIKYSDRQYLWLMSKETAVVCKVNPPEYWWLASIEQSLPEVSLINSEIFIPQMLNLDLPEVNGVNFQKGCYPGQEIVARLHYLGKAKRRLIKLKVIKNQDNKINIGDKLMIDKSQSLKESGQVIISTIVNDTIYCLATIEQSLKGETIYLENRQELEHMEG